MTPSSVIAQEFSSFSYPLCARPVLGAGDAENKTDPAPAFMKLASQ